MTIIKSFLICLISSFFIQLDAQEPITNAQRIYEILNYGPIGLLYGILPSTINSFNITEQCSLSLNYTINELHNGQLWSNSMIASSGKGLNNLLDGTYLNLGDFDQCLSVSSGQFNLTQKNVQNNDRNSFNGKYCLLDIIPEQSLLSNESTKISIQESHFFDISLNVSQKIDILFRFPKEIHYKIGFCLPSTCTDNDVTILINSGMWSLFLKIDNSQKQNKNFKCQLTSDLFFDTFLSSFYF